jgi:hypothetical protein
MYCLDSPVIFGIKLYNLSEISKSTGISIITLRNAIKQKRVAVRRIGRDYKCTRVEVLKYLDIIEK